MKKLCSDTVSVTGALLLAFFCSTTRAEDPANLCQTNLHMGFDILGAFRWSGLMLPPTLRDVVRDTNTAIFVCPATGHRPGGPENVHAWTDYIYFADPHDLIRDEMPLLVCPPTNHGGSFGFVLWTSGEVTRSAPAEIASLIERPWRFATNPLPRHLKIMKERTVVHVPPKYSAIYPQPYKPPGPPGPLKAD